MKPLLFRILMLFSAGLPLAVAAPPPTPDAAEIAVKRQRLAELESRAKSLRSAADAKHAVETVECKQTFLVNNCLARARDRRLVKVEEARVLEIQAALLERDIRRFELAERREERGRQLQSRQLPATVSVDGAVVPALPAAVPPGAR